jgi:hypothetical protein
MFLIPSVAHSHADIQSVALVPEAPSTTDSVVIQVSGDVFDTSVEFAPPIVNIVDDQIAITINTTHVGFGLPVVLSYSVDVPIETFSPGDYSFQVTLWETSRFSPVILDSASGNFSVTALVPALSIFSLAACCLLISGSAVVACRRLTRHCS